MDMYISPPPRYNYGVCGFDFKASWHIEGAELRVDVGYMVQLCAISKMWQRICAWNGSSHRIGLPKHVSLDGFEELLS